MTAIERLNKKKKCILQFRIYLEPVLIYTKEYTCKSMCIHAVSKKTFVSKNEEALSDKYLFLKFRVSACVERIEMVNLRSPPAFEAKSMKVAAGKWKDFSDSVNAALGVGPLVLQRPSFTSYSETYFSLSQSAVQGICHAPPCRFLIRL